MIDQEDNCTVILELNKSLGSADVIFFLRFGEGEEKRLHSKLDQTCQDKYCSIPINIRHFPNLLWYPRNNDQMRLAMIS